MNEYFHHGWAIPNTIWPTLIEKLPKLCHAGKIRSTVPSIIFELLRQNPELFYSSTEKGVQKGKKKRKERMQTPNAEKETICAYICVGFIFLFIRQTL